MVGMLQPEQGDGTTPWPGFSEEDGIDKCKMTLDDASVADDAAEATGKQAPQPTDDDRSEQIQKTLKAMADRKSELQAADPAFAARPLAELNSAATKALKAGDPLSAVAIYDILFDRSSKSNITHPELYVCYSNCSAACLELELYEQAMSHAEKCTRLAEASLRRNARGSATFIKSFVRKGRAQLALRRHREAVMTFEKGLAMDPFNPDLKLGLEAANQGVLQDLLEGRGHERRAIEYPATSQRITYHPYSAPLHRVRTEDMLPLRLLTPFQAENDYHIKDTYNYMTVQADIRMPVRHFTQLEDAYHTGQYRAAIQAAVESIEAQDTDCRVLNLGAGAGLHAALALGAGARHVTAVERWLYLALACKETLQENKVDEERYKVVYKRPTDLKIKEDVPVCCNVLIANIFDEGLLTSGIIPAVRHALGCLTTHDAIILPASATVFMQAVEIRTTEAAGFDMSAANLYRWHPAYAAGVPFDPEAIKPLSAPQEVWHFDFGAPPDKSDVKNVDVEFTTDGRVNAIMYWYELRLFGDIALSSGPEAATAAPGLRYLRPAVQYLAGELRVEPGAIIPIIASHNTVRMRFDIESADYLHLMKPDASFPHNHFAMLADSGRLEAYNRAIRRAVARCKQADGEAHVLDMGTGTGVLALMAAKAGATSVVACDLHESLCDIARKAAAANGLAKKISVVNRDAALLERGRAVRALGVNLVVADVFDCGLLGDQFQYLLELTRRKVIQPGATVIPSAATVYCMGIEALTTQVEGINLSSFNKYRWDGDYSAVRLSDLPHRRLTKPTKVTEVFFSGEQRPKLRENLVKLEVIKPGMLNAVVFWFDLHLDDTETLSNAPAGIDVNDLLDGEKVLAASSTGDGAGSSSAEGSQASSDPPSHEEHHWGQALQYLDRAVPLDAGRKVTLLAKRDGAKLRFALRQGVGEWVGRAPWKIEWGGGSSVENPHFQRVHYCELLVRDFLMRCRSKRFPPIEKDVNMVLAHCGSLFLDTAAVQEAGHELVVLEKIHTDPEFSPGASLEALTKRPLRLH